MTQGNGALTGLTIIDLSYRLPGPLAGHLLAGLGAKVIKIEDSKFKDPFVFGLFAGMDDSFAHWYQELNQRKEIVRLDFSSPEDKEKIHQYVKEADGLLMGVPPKVQAKLEIDRDNLKRLNPKIAVVSPKASIKDHGALHDLNALGLAGLLELYVSGKKDAVLAPPFLPIAGISFGQKLATALVANMLAAQRNNSPSISDCYLLETTQEVFTPFYGKTLKDSGQKKFLHNGLYPCYSLYRTKDEHYMALAAVEEKFWVRFCQLFDLNLKAEDRFHFEDASIFLAVESKISALSLSEIQTIIREEDICLTAVN